MLRILLEIDGDTCFDHNLKSSPVETSGLPVNIFDNTVPTGEEHIFMSGGDALLRWFTFIDNPETYNKSYGAFDGDASDWIYVIDDDGTIKKSTSVGYVAVAANWQACVCIQNPVDGKNFLQICGGVEYE